MTTQLTTLPTGMQLPAHLQTPDAAAQIAAANAAAAGGIRTGGFPKISIEGSKFHEVDASVDGGNPRTYMVAAQPGQPPLPMMCLEAVIIAANPALVKTYYAQKWQKGSDQAPDCQSSNGVTPDASVAQPQSALCATCPQNQWGSKISEATGKEVKACSDSKQMVVLPAADLHYKALGLSVTPAALGEWGKYVKALSDRNIPVNSVVTNLTFDHTASFPKLQFAFNRFLTAEEYALAVKRGEGDDVKLIVSPSRTPAAPALPAPAPVAALPGQPITPPVAYAPPPAPVVVDPYEGQPPHVKPAVDSQGGLGTPAGAMMYTTLTGKAAPQTPVPAAPPAPVPPVSAPAPFVPPPPAPTPAPQPVAFGAGAAPAAPAAAAPAAPVPEKPKRKPRAPAVPAPVAAAPTDLSYLPPAIQAAVAAVGADSDAGRALLAQFPSPAAPAAPAPAPVAAPVAPPTEVPATPAPAPAGFGAAQAAPAAPIAPQPAAAPATTAAGASLKALLEAKLGIKPAATAPA